jgi:hypothetical protein
MYYRTKPVTDSSLSNFYQSLSPGADLVHQADYEALDQLKVLITAVRVERHGFFQQGDA